MSSELLSGATTRSRASCVYTFRDQSTTVLADDVPPGTVGQGSLCPDTPSDVEKGTYPVCHVRRVIEVHCLWTLSHPI